MARSGAAAGDGRLAGFAGAAAFLVAAGVAVAVTQVCWRGVPTDRAGLRARLRLLPASVLERRLLARLDLAAGRPRAARARLAAAVRRAPWSSLLWLERAEAALHSGRADEARAAAGKGAALAPRQAGTCHRAALVLLQVGDQARAAPLLGCVLASAPARTADVLDLAHAVWADDALVLRQVVPADAPGVRGFLAWAHDRALVDAARRGWEALVPYGATGRDRLRHVDFLIARGEIDEADALWAAAHGPRGAARVFDGDFEGDPVGGGFGWILREPAGARVGIRGAPAAAHGARGLAIEFTGGNPDFAHVSQVVPVAGGRRYRLSALVRSEDLTSLAGPRLGVRPHAACAGLVPAEGPELRGTRPWGPVSLEFTTPPGCRAVVVLVRRPATARLDRDLRGRLYVDDVRLADLGAPIADPS